MPYIAPRDRDRLNSRDTYPFTPGELNYLITGLVDGYVYDHGLNYTTLNAVVGVLECAKLELYRRIAAPYEDQKRHDNGDVYSVGPR